MKATFDTHWQTRALEGHADAIAQLAGEVTEALYRFCFYRVGGNRHLCEEIVQETFVTAITRLAQYEPDRAGDDIFPWLTGLARNEVRRVLAREKLGASLEAMWSMMDRELREVFSQIESEPFNDEMLQREETQQMVNATMSQLPTKYRAALEDKYVQGLSVREIAASSALTEKAVESQLSRARRAFRETFMALARNLEQSLPRDGTAY